MNPIIRLMKRYIEMPQKSALSLLFVCVILFLSCYPVQLAVQGRQTEQYTKTQRSTRALISRERGVCHATTRVRE